VGFSSERIAPVEATVSRHPRLPQRQTAPSGRLDVPELPRDHRRSVVQPSAEHEPRADAGGHHHVDDVREPSPGAERDLGERPEIGVVVELDRDLEPAGELLAGLDAGPIGEHRGALHALVPVDRRRQGHPRADDPRPVDSRIRHDVRRELRGCVERILGGGVHVELDQGLREHGGREVGDCDPHMTVAEVDSERCACCRVEAQENRRTSPAGRLGTRVGRLDDQASGLEVGDEGRDGCAGDAGHPCEVGAAGRSGPTQGVDDPEAVQLPQGSKGAELDCHRVCHGARGSQHFRTLQDEYHLLSGKMRRLPAKWGRGA
jgi:hypothetical protein